MNTPPPTAPADLDMLAPEVFLRLAETSTDAIGIARLDSHLLYANASLRRLFGLTDPATLNEQSLFDHYPPAEAERLREEILPQLLATGAWVGPLELVSKSGASWTYIQNLTLLHDERGEAAGFTAVITDLTARAHHNEARQIHEATIHSSLNAIAMASMDGRLSYVNPAFVELWRLGSAAEALGRSPLEFWQRPQQAEAVMVALQQVGHWQGEMEALRADGSSAVLQLSAHLVRDDSGQPICMMSSFIDVSGRSQAEQELLRSEALLNAIVQQLPAMVFLKRASDLRFELFNRAGETLLGLEQAALLGKTDHDLFPPEQAQAFTARDREVLASGVQLDIPEEAILASTGETRLLHTRKIGIYDAAGEPTHLLGVSLDITEQKRLEAALHEQREFSSQLVDAAPVIILLLDPGGGIRFVNPWFEQLSGYRLDEIQGQDWFSLFLPTEDQDRIHSLFTQLNHESPMRGNNNPILTRSGEQREIQWSNQALHDADGGVTGVLAIGLDVTEHGRSEARLNEAQRIARVGSWELDLSSGELSWTDEIFHLFELDKARFAPSYEAFLALVHPDDRDQVDAAYTQSLADRQPYRISHRLRMADGRIKWVEERCLTHFDADGRPLVSRGTVQDISERVATEAKLAEYRDHLEQLVQARTQALEQQSQRNTMIVNAAFDGFFAADLQGRLCDCNHAYCEMLGYSREELLQLSITDIEADERPDEVAAHIEKVIQSGADQFDTRHRRKDGSLIEVNINVSLETMGETAQFFAFVHDITPRKQAEAEILRRRDEAERANAAKTDFLSRMSHELRTPLNAIIGFGELLETDPEPPLSAIQRDNVREIRQAGDHLLALVNEVLDLSRIERGQLEIRLQAVAITPMIESCLTQLQPQAARRGLHMTTLHLDTPCAVQADPTRLREVLFNLLTNAIKYNRPGGDIQVSCTLEPVVAPTDGSTASNDPTGERHLRISVRDTGPGIPAKALPRLFRPFERLESAYEGIEGAGIGLALCKQLVEAMQGRIGVDSVPGKGSNFWFELPMANAIPAEPAAGPAQQTPARDGQRRVLCIEDNAANLRLMHKIVAPRTDIAELLTATSAEAGLEIAAAQRPALILLDINLPGMDGFEALRRLRENPATRDIPVVAVTANAMTTDIERGRAEGFADYLTKPLDLVTFNAMLDRLLS